MKILIIGDIVGEAGRSAVGSVLPGLRKHLNLDFVIANAENAAGGKGLTRDVADEIFSFGVNVFTLGNHTWARKDIEQLLDDERILRPANYPPGAPGRGWNIYSLSEKISVAVLNLMGRVYMPLLDCPFRAADPALEEIRKKTRNIIVDFHAEITSEKMAMGWYLNGKVSAVIGTHTHVQTADAKILSDKTAYITDCGMCGSEDSVIGMDKEIVLKKYLTSIPQRFVVSKGAPMFNACRVDIDETTGRAAAIESIYTRIDNE